MKIRANLFSALLLAMALVVPAAADQGKSKDKKPKDQARQEEQSQASEDRASERGKPTQADQRTDQDDREPDPNRDDNDRDNASGDAMRFHGLDSDGDGRITRAEWRGNDNSFQQHDTNGDGVLAGAEITPAEPLTDNEDPSDDWREWWDFHQGQFDTGAFDGMDKDENQSVSREEWAGGFALFDRLDRDHDGVITQQEYEDREFRGLTREALFARLDANADGRLEPTEWWWSRDAFALVDRDSSGWISPDELLHRGEPQPR
jgi:Ca2+-binding EF-hand superfamily protein